MGEASSASAAAPSAGITAAAPPRSAGVRCSQERGPLAPTRSDRCSKHRVYQNPRTNAEAVLRPKQLRVHVYLNAGR